LRLGIIMCVLLAAFTAQAAVYTDHLGRRVEAPDRPKRILSLAPNLTETLYAVGAGDRIAGVTDFCDFPAEARSKARVGGLVNPNLEVVASLQPDLALLTYDSNRRDTMEAFERLGIPTFVVKIERVADIARAIRDIGRVAGQAAAGEAVAAEFDQRRARVEAMVAGRPLRRVLLLVWLQPIVTIGRRTFLADFLERAGAESVIDSQAQPWPRPSLEAVVRADPEFLVVPKSSDFAPTRDELLRLPGWKDLAAVRGDRIVYLADVQRPGPRLAGLLESLARALHPAAAGERRPAPSGNGRTR
jgi:iron complex transport system substrate-binding protein